MDDRPVWMQGWPSPSPILESTNHSPESRWRQLEGGARSVSGDARQDLSPQPSTGRQSVAEMVSEGTGARMLRGSRLPSPSKSFNGNSHRPSARGDASISDLVDEIEHRVSRQQQEREEGQRLSPVEIQMMDTSDSPSRSPFGSGVQPSANGHIEPPVSLSLSAWQRPEQESLDASAPSPLQREYEMDPYLARMRANVAALGEVTRRLRASASLDDVVDNELNHSRSIMLDSERTEMGLGIAADARDDMTSIEIEAAQSRDKVARSLIESGSLQFRRVNPLAPDSPSAASSAGDDRLTRDDLGGESASAQAAASGAKRSTDTCVFARFTMILNHAYDRCLCVCVSVCLCACVSLCLCLP